MKVILLDNIRGVGQVGDIRVVTDGYARNYLLPRNLAKIATPETEKEAESLRRRRAVIAAHEGQRAKDTATRLEGITIEITELANEIGTLFSQVDKKDLVNKIREVTSITLEPEMIELEEPFKNLGEHSLTLVLGPDVTAQIKVKISAKKTF